MAKVNVKERAPKRYTHEGARAATINPLQELRRSVLACLLWEDAFYETGESNAERIAELVKVCDSEAVANLAVEARHKMYLRHVPLFLVRELARKNQSGKDKQLPSLIASTITKVVSRADEMGELVSIYRKTGGGRAIPASFKRGLAEVFKKFDEYQLAKYSGDGAAIKPRDIMFLVHPKPEDTKQKKLWKKLADKKLESPDTWEVALSAGADKKATFERLIKAEMLGGLALLRNLRNMEQADVDEKLVRKAISENEFKRVLPFRFLAAARYAPKYSDAIEKAMMRTMAEFPRLEGKTAIVVDNSGSMYGTPISKKSDLDRADAACALALLAREICEQSIVIGFGSDAKIVPAHYRGLALIEQIKAGPGGATMTDTALALAEREGYDRIIVITDEQSHQTIRKPSGIGYFINVSTYKNGIGYGAWTHIDGFSERVFDFIREKERLDNEGEE